MKAKVSLKNKDSWLPKHIVYDDVDLLFMPTKELIKIFLQKQSNWNSLREWLEKQKEDSKICKEWNRKNNFNDIDYERDIKRFDFVLDKMNELEGGK